MKKFFSFIIIIALIASLAGCGNSTFEPMPTETPIPTIDPKVTIEKELDNKYAEYKQVKIDYDKHINSYVEGIIWEDFNSKTQEYQAKLAQLIKDIYDLGDRLGMKDTEVTKKYFDPLR
jgi:predicted small lipoprotein YifL